MDKVLVEAKNAAKAAVVGDLASHSSSAFSLSLFGSPARLVLDPVGDVEDGLRRREGRHGGAVPGTINHLFVFFSVTETKHTL